MLPMALAGLCVCMVSHPAAALAGPPLRQQLPGLVVPLDDKAQRTPVQRKVSSQLLVAIAQPDDATGGSLRGGAGIDVDAERRALVDIDATVTDELLEAIVSMEGIVVNNFPQYDAVRARVPFDQVESLAERSDVRFIRPADMATTNSPGIVPGRR
jgi:hypothetical protein